MNESTLKLVISSMAFLTSFLYALKANDCRNDGEKFETFICIVISLGTLIFGRALL